MKLNKKGELGWNTIISIILLLITFLTILGAWYEIKTTSGLVVDSASCIADSAKIAASSNKDSFWSKISTNHFLKPPVTPACLSSSIYIKDKASGDNSIEETFLKKLNIMIKSCNNTYNRLSKFDNKYNVRCGSITLKYGLDKKTLESINLNSFSNLNKNIISEIPYYEQQTNQKSQTTQTKIPNTEINQIYSNPDTLIISINKQGIKIETITDYFTKYDVGQVDIG